MEAQFQPARPRGAQTFRMTDGSSRYEMERPWQRPSPHGTVGIISQLAVGGDGRVFVLQRTAPHVLVYRPDGSLERSFDDPRLTTGHGIAVDAQDRLYVVSYDAHQVLVFDRAFHPVLALGEFNHPRWAAPFNHPTDVAVAADGEIYVSDGYGNAHVHRFAADGRHLQTWGGVGKGPGEFATPHGICILPDERVAVCDRDNDRIQLFDRTGRFLGSWGDVLRPMAICCRGSEVFVSEQAPRISRLGLDGRIGGRFRAFGVYPHGIAVDPQGHLFVAEQGATHCVTRYRRLGPA